MGNAIKIEISPKALRQIELLMSGSVPELEMAFAAKAVGSKTTKDISAPTIAPTNV